MTKARRERKVDTARIGPNHKRSAKSRSVEKRIRNDFEKPT